MSYVKKGQKLIPNTGGMFPVDAMNVVKEGETFTSLNRTWNELKAAYDRKEIIVVFFPNEIAGEYYINIVNQITASPNYFAVYVGDDIYYSHDPNEFLTNEFEPS